MSEQKVLKAAKWQHYSCRARNKKNPTELVRLRRLDQVYAMGNLIFFRVIGVEV
jgi:hypothetical protein